MKTINSIYLIFLLHILLFHFFRYELHLGLGLGVNAAATSATSDGKELQSVLKELESENLEITNFEYIRETGDEIKVGCRGDVDMQTNTKMVKSFFVSDPVNGYKELKRLTHTTAAFSRSTNNSSSSVVVNRTIFLKEFPPQCFRLLFSRAPTVGFCEGPPGPNGKVGGIGKPGLKGPPGVDGTPGKPGKNGNPGTDGVIGDVGQQGPQGDNGELGIDGLFGDPGDNGPPGVDGSDGEQGDSALIL